MNTDIDEILLDTEENMEKSIQALQKGLSSIRTGRASLSILDGISVDYYNTIQPLNQVATLSVPESNMIVIQPWDISIIAEIEKAIQRSNLGLNPQNDGKVIRIVVPPLTEERRKQLVKNVKAKGEDFKVAIRNSRRDGNSAIKKLLNDKSISEDDARRKNDEIQKITDDFIKKVDEISKKKETEILEF
jgi:ribosome recycling factor